MQVPGALLAYEDRVMEVTAQGVVLRGTSTLAGSCTTMHAIFVTLLTTFGLPLEEASALCSGTPARVARLPHVGSLDVGKRADLVCLASIAEPHTIQRVYVAGVPL
jgi:N-acetylglucosamine-6-phosphate deacetylase